MAQTAIGQNQIYTYTASPNGTVTGKEALDSALQSGYRILDVFSIAANPAGQEGFSGVYVTVVVTLDGDGGDPYRRIPRSPSPS